MKAFYLLSLLLVCIIISSTWNESINSIQPIQNTIISNKTEPESNIGLLEKTQTIWKVEINCTIPKAPEKAFILNRNKIPINKEEALRISQEVFGLSERIMQDSPFRLETRHMSFDSRYDVFYHTSSSRTTWIEREVQSEADNIVSKLFNIWEINSPIDVNFNGVSPSSFSSSSNSNITSIRTVRASYSLSVNGIPLRGRLTDFCIDFNNEGIEGAQFFFPILEIGDEVEVTVSPFEAIEFAMSGVSDNDILGIYLMCMRPPANSTVTVTGIELIYYIPESITDNTIVPVYEITVSPNYQFWIIANR